MPYTLSTNDKKWIILKLFKKILKNNLSVFYRQYIFNSLYLIKKIRDISKNDSQLKLTNQSIEFIIQIVQNDAMITTEHKKKYQKNFIIYYWY